MAQLQTVSERLATDGVVVANAWRIAGKWVEALTLINSLLLLSEMIEDVRIAGLLLMKGRILNDQALFGGVANVSERETTFARAIAYAEKTDDTALLGAVWSTWGMSLHVGYFENQRAHEPPHELEYFERGLALRTEADDAWGVSESLFQIGLVHQVIRNDLITALPYFQQSYECAVDLHDDMLASYAIRHLGYARAEQGDMAGAQSHFEESLHRRQLIGFTPGVAMAQFALARLLIEIGTHSAALPLLESARDTFAMLHSEGWAATMEKEIKAIKGE